MTTRTRTLSGLAILALAITFLGVSVSVISRALDAPTRAAEVRQPRERVFSVPVGTLSAETISPTITSYGQIASGRSLEVRSSVGGEIVWLADEFRDGGMVDEGQELLRIDPARLETAVAMAEADLAEAEADLARAVSALTLAELDADAAQEQLDLRAEALERQEALAEREISRAADLEAAALARAAAQQTAINRQQAVAAEQARIDQAEIAVQRAQLALENAQRDLEDAVITAPFSGVMTRSAVSLGRLLSANEQLGVLIDPRNLEVSFRVTNTQFERLLNGQGQLRNAEITLVFQTWRNAREFSAVIDRADAEVGEGQVGRLIYARLSDPDPMTIRPGDFVTVHATERPMSDVVEIPAAAATPDGRILLIGAGNRLEEVNATILRHQGDRLIVTDVPVGHDYVLSRALQLGPGLQVEPVQPAAEGDAPAGADAAPESASDTIALDEERRAALIAFIEANDQMRPETRERVLGELSQPEVPRATVERFEARMAEQ
ncbi:HlyD family efflux transporter periplasmic adaptor subunit [Maritalea mobilis]|uniref:efflux RND transporter periplasmic adaptor subunit n=1 Tax=Maritalea mobilis TaxID=483324 RepID=UPI001C94F79C|nr:HlyD family efflux transporter periplasmic adaptor subunit [Maritalea mobilis]MBY6202858.1 HlyD family efflux transporter periplasmic adaptor subunit [Maritalea mobilis]